MITVAAKCNQNDSNIEVVWTTVGRPERMGLLKTFADQKVRHIWLTMTCRILYLHFRTLALSFKWLNTVRSLYFFFRITVLLCLVVGAKLWDPAPTEDSKGEMLLTSKRWVKDLYSNFTFNLRVMILISFSLYYTNNPLLLLGSPCFFIQVFLL